MPKQVRHDNVILSLMIRFLPVLFALFVIHYSLFIPPSFAQEPPSTAQGNAWENFENLFIPDTLKQVNCSGLPLEVCTGIKLQISPTVARSSLSTQATTPAQTDNKKEKVGNAAGQYIIASGIHTPPEVANASTNNIISDFIAFIAKTIGDLLDRGEKQAKNYAGTVLPQDVARENFAQGGPQSAMDKALPLVQCSELPAGVGGCSQSSNPFTKEKSEKSSPELASQSQQCVDNGKVGSRLDYEIPFYKTDKYGREIDDISQKLLNDMDNLASAVKKRWPGSLIDNWKEVYDLAISSGWNPAFVISVWIEETAASDACTLEEQGKDGIWDFGVVSEKDDKDKWVEASKTYCSDLKNGNLTNFYEQLNYFVDKKIQDDASFEEFLCTYSEGHFPCCFVINPGFIERLKPVYDCLVSDNPKSVCPAGYFKF